MKIIDQTPLLDANGQLSLMNRIQGMLKYGFSWPATLEAQAKVILLLNKVIEKGYTIVRNQQLGISEIIVPLTLIGPTGIYVIEATPLKGLYQAHGDEWGTISNGNFQPASVNLITRTARLAKILQVYFERQGMKLAAPVEPFLLAADPGLHIESVRPSIRPVMSDAIERFVANLLTGRPIYNAQAVDEFVERLQKPRSAHNAEQPEPENDPFAHRDETPFEDTGSSRMQSILNAPQSDSLIETGEILQGVDFALEDERSPTVLVKNPYEPEEEAPPPAAAPVRKRRVFGMTITQLLVLIFLFIAELCVIGFGVWIFTNQ